MTNNAINSNIPIEVTKGGTQASSFVAYAPIVGGTTSTGALQSVASAGNAGEFLVSGGPSALPTWQAGGGGGFSSINIQTFSATGTYTPSANTKQVVVYICGGGGGGANTSTGGGTAVGSGGGPGETRIGTYSAAQLASAAPITITIGAGGSGGNNGQASSFGSLITTGYGETPSPNYYSFGGTTTGTGGSFAITGSTAGIGMIVTGTPTIVSGHGGSSFFAQGAPSVIGGAPQDGLPGTNGSGGSGSSSAGSAHVGGSGGNGYCVVYEYIG